MSDYAREGLQVEVPAEALAALDSAMDGDGFVEGGSHQVNPINDGFDPSNQGLPVTQPVPTPSPGETPAPDAATPEGEQTLTEEDSFTDRFDPNSLPPELQPAYRQLQADYTRKRQQDAEVHRLIQANPGINLEQAVSLVQQMSTPEGVLQFVQQASEYLTDQGYADWDEPEAPESSPTAGLRDQLSALDGLVSSDPDVAPLAEAVKSIADRLDQIDSRWDDRLAAEREELQVLQTLGEIQRQEGIIRADNPNYSDADIDSIYALASHYDGDLLQAQGAYEADFARRLGGYMAGKQAVDAPIHPVGAPTGALPEVELGYNPLDSKEAHSAALEVLKLIENQPEL